MGLFTTHRALVTLLLLSLAACWAAAQRLASCPNVPTAIPKRRMTCTQPNIPRITVRNSPSSAGNVRIAVLRPNRTIRNPRIIRPGATVGFNNICPGFQIYLEAASCGKCIRIFQVFARGGRAQTVFVPAGFCSGPPSAGDDRPNIIVAMADDIGSRDFGYLGGSIIRTPIIDRLARTSLSFLSAWATPLCRTTRAIIMTGKLPFATMWFSHKMPPANPAFRPFGPGIGNLASAAGYKALWVGKWQIFGKARGRSEYGFDNYTIWRHSDAESVDSLVRKYDGPVPPDQNDWGRYNHPVLSRDDEFVDTDPLDFSSNIFLEDLLRFMRRTRANGDKSFVYWPMTLAHKDWDFDKGEMGWIRMPRLNQNDQVIGYQSGTPSFKNMVEYLDTMIGLLIKGLKRNNLYSSTVIIFCTDNGSVGSEESQGFKTSTRDERGVRVPVLIHGGGGRIPAKSTRAMFSLVDVYATVAGFMQYRGPARRNSYDFSKFALGQTSQGPRKWSFSFLNDKRMLRTRDWVYDGNKVLFNCANTTVIENCQRISNPQANPQTRMIKNKMDRILGELERTGYSNARVF